MKAAKTILKDIKNFIQNIFNRLRVIFKMSFTDIHAIDNGGKTLLMHSAEKGDKYAVAYLLKKRVDINTKDHVGNTALTLASNEGHSECVQLLLDKEDIDVNIKNYLSYTALMLASNEGHSECVQHLLNREDTDVNARNDLGTALIFAADKKHEKCIRCLMNHKYINSDFSVRNNPGINPVSAEDSEDTHISPFEENLKTNIKTEDNDGITLRELKKNNNCEESTQHPKSLERWDSSDSLQSWYSLDSQDSLDSLDSLDSQDFQDVQDSQDDQKYVILNNIYSGVKSLFNLVRFYRK